MSIPGSRSFLQTLLPLTNWVRLALERTHTGNKSRQITNSWSGWTCVACKPHHKPPRNLERGIRNGILNIFVAILNFIETPDLFKYLYSKRSILFHLILPKMSFAVSLKDGSTSWHFKVSACSNKVGTNYICVNFFNRIRNLSSYCWQRQYTKSTVMKLALWNM